MTTTTETHPRWFATAIRATLGNTAIVTEVLDDLDEAYAQRVRSGDLHDARRWYRWQAVRTLPYLAASGLRRVRMGDLGLLATRISTAVALTLAVEIVIGAGIAGILWALGVTPNFPSPTPTRWWYLPWLPFYCLEMSLLGYIGAWLDTDRPLSGPLLLSGLSVAWTVFALGRIPSQPALLVLTYATLHGAAVIGGGLLRMRQAARTRMVGTTPR